MTDTTPHIVCIDPLDMAAAVDIAAETLRQGKLVVFPTDTVYGLAADPRVDDAHERLFLAKGRDARQPIAYLAGSVAHVDAFGAQLNAQEQALAEAFWPGALTLILKMRDIQQGEQGFRVPNHAFTLMLLTRMDTPLLVTSANTSGHPPAPNIENAVQQLGAHVSLYVNGGEAQGGAASSVVRASGSDIELLREEALSLNVLSDALRS